MCSAFFIGLQLHLAEAEHPRQKGLLAAVAAEWTEVVTKLARCNTGDMVLACKCYSSRRNATTMPRAQVPVSPF